MESNKVFFRGSAGRCQLIPETGQPDRGWNPIHHVFFCPFLQKNTETHLQVMRRLFTTKSRCLLFSCSSLVVKLFKGWLSGTYRIKHQLMCKHSDVLKVKVCGLFSSKISIPPWAGAQLPAPVSFDGGRVLYRGGMLYFPAKWGGTYLIYIYI